MLPIAENLSVYIVSSFEIRQYSCIPRLHKRKNFLAMGQRFCKKTALFRGAAPDRRILPYCERRATMPITAPFLQKSIVPWLYCLPEFSHIFLIILKLLIINTIAFCSLGGSLPNSFNSLSINSFLLFSIIFAPFYIRYFSGNNQCIQQFPRVFYQINICLTIHLYVYISICVYSFLTLHRGGNGLRKP